MKIAGKLISLCYRYHLERRHWSLRWTRRRQQSIRVGCCVWGTCRHSLRSMYISQDKLYFYLAINCVLNVTKNREAFSSQCSNFQRTILTIPLKCDSSLRCGTQIVFIFFWLFHYTLLVYPDGKVCISILHPPGTDSQNSQETAAERWRPIHGVESIILSVISMLNDPNIDSPANLDAAIEFRDNIEAYNKKVRKLTQQSVDSLWSNMQACSHYYQ